MARTSPQFGAVWVAGLLGVAVSFAKRSAAEFKSLAIHQSFRDVGKRLSHLPWTQGNVSSSLTVPTRLFDN